MASEALLFARGVRKAFGGLVAVDGMEIEVAEGELVGLIGPNGAGKSTFFNVIAGYHKPDAGEIRFGGASIFGLAAHEVARRGLVRTWQIARPIPRLTVRENLLLAPGHQTGERLWGPLLFWKVAREEREIVDRADETLRFFELAHLADEYAGSLSGGQKKLLEIARAVMLGPRMILLDEPMAGVNPTLAKKIMEKVQELRADRGLTFLLIEHDMEIVFRYCGRIIVMAEGRKLAEGDEARIRANQVVIDAYLGGAP